MLDAAKFLGVFVIVVTSTPGADSSQDCTTPRETTGQCIYINQCPIILNILKSNQLSPEMRAHLKEYSCGYDGQHPKVCCEKDANPCTTPDQNPGVCVPITRCSLLLKLLEQKPFLSGTTVDVLKRSECQFGSKARVCCPMIEKKKEVVKEIRKEKLPQPGVCGVQELQDKVLGGDKMGLSEFPWMALLEYGPYGNPKLACGGSLISERFVLTAAHCVIGPDVSRLGNLQRVRLGEYDTDNKTDCINKIDYVECSEPIQRIEIERIISHDGFNLRNRNKEHDIALVQMRRAVKYTEFTRPICLPPPYFSLPAKLFVSGWGRTETTSHSNVKLKLQLPYYDHGACKAIYGKLRFPVHLVNGQICAGGEAGKDSCTGDSGGPLMAMERHSKYSNIWFQAGLVSFGPIPCGQKQPGVYTNLMEYLPWVHKTVTNTVI